MIDASIPLKGLLINRAEEDAKRQQVQMNQLRVQEYQQGQENRERLADLLPKAAAGDQAAMGQVAAIDTDVWSKLNSAQADLLRRNQDKILMGAKIVRQINPQDEAGWQRARQAAQSVGLDMSDVPPNFDPNYVQSLISVADAMEKDRPAPSSYEEYTRAQADPKYKQFLEERRGPIVANNGDGTFTLIPRSMGGGSQQPSSAPPAQAVDYLRKNPGLKAQFDAKYGAGAADRALGGQMGSRPSGGFQP